MVRILLRNNFLRAVTTKIGIVIIVFRHFLKLLWYKTTKVVKMLDLILKFKKLIIYRLQLSDGHILYA
jgi:hypothetical protein